VPDKAKYRAGCIVLLSVLILLVAGDLLSQGGWRHWAAATAMQPPVLQYVWAAVLGFLVGFAELVSRYRDEPWRVAMLPPGLIFIGLNGSAGCIALFLLQVFPDELHTPTNPVLCVMVAGFGAMVVIRTKLLTVRQPGGSDVAVGPAFLLDTMLAAINRDVDRRRALQRTARVAVRAAELQTFKYSDANDFLIASLGAFQNMDEEIAKSLRSQLQLLVNDQTLKSIPDQLKFVIAGYSILTEFGDRTFDGVFSALKSYLEGTGQARN
jgi:hypothetical protein